MKKIFIALLLMFSVSNIYPGFFSSYDKKSPEENVHDLAIEQISNPDDPYINYNLGVALYQTCKYDSAKNNFERAVSNAKNRNLKERSYFNLANSCYKNALSQLPVNWESESTKVEQDKLGAAIENTKQAVKNYESLLELNKEHEQSKANLKKAKELLEKLMKKQQQKQDQKKDEKKDQSKQDQQNQQDQQQKQNGQQDKSQTGEQKKESGQEQKQERQQDKSSGQEKEQNQAQAGEQQESQQQKGAEQQTVQQAQAQQAVGQAAQKESAEEKSMRLMLENLQSDEDSLQKLIIQRQTKDQKPLQTGQKPW